jgi:hypothetical protein
MNKMESKVMMVLGGYGIAGRHISRLLLKETGVHLVIAGRDVQKAQHVAALLNSRFPGKRVKSLQVDAADSGALRKAFESCDTVVTCVPISALGIGGGIVRAAFDSRVNYVDITLDEEKRRVLRRLADRIQGSGLYFMTEAGFMPGLPSAMAFSVARQLERIESLRFGMLEKEATGAYGSAADLLIYGADPAYVYQNGAWQKVPFSASAQIDFGSVFGTRTCYPMDLYELRCLPDQLALQEVGFYAAGLNPVTDVLMLLWMVAGLYRYGWSLRLGAKLGVWTAKTFTKPPFTTTLQLDATGEVDHRKEQARMVISHNDGYEATAIAAVAGILQLLDGSIEAGVTMMGHGVDASRYLADIERLGMKVLVRHRHPDHG